MLEVKPPSRLYKNDDVKFKANFPANNYIVIVIVGGESDRRCHCFNIIISRNSRNNKIQESNYHVNI